MPGFDKTMTEIRELDAEFEKLTGHNAFGYVSEPEPGHERFAFHDGTVEQGRTAALKKMRELAEIARSGEADTKLWW